MIVVTHLLGTGHLARALVLARAFQAAGHRVHFVSGGMPASHLSANGLRFVQLPPLRSDGVNFIRLLDENGAEATADLLTQRQTELVGTLHTACPDVLITELFPFGRRVLSAEFHALLEAADAMRPRPLICASVRDILAPPSKPAKATATDELISKYYDAVLVHADPSVVPLDASWPVSELLSGKLRYTGFVSQPPAAPHPEGMGSGCIIVSAGGGDVGASLYAAAIAAADLDHGLKWHLLVGGRDAKSKSAELQASASRNVTAEPARSDFRQMLHHAEASVSMCGYNTALDILQTGTAAVFVPFDAGGEVEQSLRADALQQLPAIRVLRSRDLSGARLLSEVKALTDAPPRQPATDGLDGATQTVRLVEEMTGERRDAR